MLSNYTRGEKMTLGMPFLDFYYQAYDMERNQVALIPNIYANQTSMNGIMADKESYLAQPRIFPRPSFIIYVSAMTTLAFCILALSSFT